MVPLIERRLGRKLPVSWLDALKARLVAVMRTEVEPVAGALEALAALDACALPWRVASNSTVEEMEAKLGRVGLLGRVSGRMHTPRDVSRGKPAPDLYLFAAAAEGVAPAECVVVEDSATGVRAAAAAGMDCLAYAPHTDGAALSAAGGVPFRSMFELPGLVGAALEGDRPGSIA
jgi:beta-phosphoglucomutase-like phosphatase (HAD superfamily)